MHCNYKDCKLATDYTCCFCDKEICVEHSGTFYEPVKYKTPNMKTMCFTRNCFIKAFLSTNRTYTDMVINMINNLYENM